MPIMRLNDIVINNLPSSDRPVFYTDSALPGFGVRVGKKSKTFVAIVGTHARRKVTVGKYPATCLKTARHKALELMTATTPVPTATTFVEAFETYLDVYVKPSYRTRPAKEAERLI